jgi:hypothetical protein
MWGSHQGVHADRVWLSGDPRLAYTLKYLWQELNRSHDTDREMTA